MKYQYLFFDLDGTLSDPKEGIINAFLYVINELKLERPSDESMNTFIGPPLTETFGGYYHLTKEETFRAIDLFRAFYKKEGMFQNVLYPGISDVLRKLKNQGYQMYVATSKLTSYAQDIIEYFGLGDFFTEVAGCLPDNTRLEKDEIIEYLLDKHIDSQERDLVIMIGDRKHDLIGAKKNGISALGVGWGYGSLQELEENGADFIVRNLKELEEFFLRDLNNIWQRSLYIKIL